jgi:hypothetical protein
MLTLLSLAFLGLLIALVIGLIRPFKYWPGMKTRPSRKKLGLIFGIAAFICFILIETVAPPTKTNDERIVATSSPSAISYTYDIPLLVGKNIDGVRSVLGKAIDNDIEPTSLQIQVGVDIWSNAFNKDDKELLVTFNPKSRVIIDFFIGTDDPSGKTQNTKRLLEMGNLKENDSRYKLEFVKVIKDPSYFTGVKVIPN